MNAALQLPGRVLRGWMDRRARRGRSVALGYRQVFILPTRGGLVFTALIIAMWLGAVNYNNNMAFLLCFLLAGLGLVAQLHAFRNLQGLHLSAAPAEPVFAGDPAQFPVRLENPSPRPRPGLVVDVAGGRQPAAADLPSGGQRTVTLAVPTERRGTVPLPVVVTETTFPGGLLRAWARTRLDAECVVYPLPEEGPVPAPSSDHTADGDRSTARGDDDFAGLRTYQPADPLRRIAWRTLAQDQELQTKQFAGQASSPRWLDYANTGLEGVEARLSRLCRWVLDAEAAGRAFGLRLPGTTIPPANGPAHRARCLAALSRFPG